MRLALTLPVLFCLAFPACDSAASPHHDATTDLASDTHPGDSLPSGADAGPEPGDSSIVCEEGATRCGSADEVLLCAGGQWIQDSICAHDLACQDGNCVASCWCHPNDACGDDGCGGTCGGGCDDDSTCVLNGSWYECT